ncbi:MAG: 23S rRNA (guanosine(2251)-2'-O)-methyltransferase RlmB [Acutalibacteraceae bacterium]
MEENRNNGNDLIVGRNCINEALRNGRPIDKLFVAKGASGSLSPLIARAKKSGAVIKEVDTKKLDYLSGGATHQGVVAFASAKEYSSVEDILAVAKEKGEPPFIIILDEIEDPHNLGAIIRTAECTGVHGVIIPKRRSAGLSLTADKASAGALEYVPVARVTNIAQTIDMLKENGVWIYGADMDGQCYCNADLKGAAALVIGNEGKGIGRLVREKCDCILSLPMCGRINSLNASVAAGVLMYEFARQRQDY